MPGDELKGDAGDMSNSRYDTPKSVTKPTPHSQCASYRRLMKNTKFFSPLMWLLLGSVALAQAGIADVPGAPQPQDPDTTKIKAAKIEPTAQPKAGLSSEGTLISQARRYPQLHPGRMERPGQAYRSHYPMPGLSPMGALIGFGAGAALGASKSQDGTSGGRVLGGLLLGGLGALIGGAIGNVPPFWHSRRNYPGYGPSDDEDEDSNLRSRNRTIEAKRRVTKNPAASSKPSAVESAVLASQEELAVP